MVQESSQPSMNSKIEIYNSRKIEFLKIAEALRRKHFQYSIIRLVIFIAGITAMILTFNYSIIFFIAIIILTIAGFGFCLFSQFKLEKEKKHHEALADINKNEVNTIINGSNSYYNGQHYEVDYHPYSLDLDIFGNFSLYRSLNRCKTYDGLLHLSNWISKLQALPDIHARQEAVKELTPDLTFRQELAAHLYCVSGQEESNPVTSIKKGFESNFEYANQPWITFYRMILPLIWLAIGIFSYFYSGWGYSLFLIFALLNFVLSVRYAKETNEIQTKISSSLNALGKYTEVLELIYSKNWNSKYLNELLRSEQKTTQVEALKQLKRLIDLLDYRLHMIPSIILNVGLLWDTRIVAKIGKWKENNDHFVAKMFETIGQAEAISSLATWAFNYEHYSYPDISKGEFNIKGSEMLHPLMNSNEAVPNDFSILQEHNISIITGSNMSGKSTLLRTLGLNMVLAYSGTKVAASEMTIPLVQIFTYMRIKDALEESVSTFKAELNRVNQILQLISQDSPSLILIDEMLRGTNSKDKLKGSIAMVKKLIESQSHAVIATHDIQLTEMAEEYPKNIKNYFFDISFQDGELEFDYRIKEGICDTFNASFLLQKMGLSI